MSSPDKKDKKDKADKKEKSDKKEKADKADKPDKKEKSDKADKKEKSDKKEKADKADKPDKKEKSDKADKTDKKEKSDKKEKADKAESKDKKDKADTKDKKPDTAKKPSGGAPAEDDVRVSGSTTYRRVKVKEDKATKTKAGVLWIPEGRSATDREFVWQEVVNANGDVHFVLLSDPDNVKYELPDIGGAPQEVVLEKKKFDERKEWKDENAKKLVSTAVKKHLANEPKFAELSKDEQSTMASNIAKEFMNLHGKLDVVSEGWIQEQCQRQVNDFINAKKAAQQANLRARAAVAAVQLKPTENLSSDLIDDQAAPLPVAPIAVDKLAPPASPLVPQASYLRDPYYHRRLRIKSSRRGVYESKLEQTTFMHPGGGDVKVLCAVGVKSGKEFSKTMIFAVARDWTGAFAFFVLEPSDTSDPAVVGGYPILQHVDFPASGFIKVTFTIDGNEFSATFRDQEHATWLHDALKMAMASMYGNGSDDNRITRMRAYSVAFSASDVAYFAGGSIPDPNAVLRVILNDDRRDGAALSAEFAQLRLCLRTPEGRDHVLRSWCRSVDESSVFKRKSAIMTNNHIQVVAEAIRSPVVHDDYTIPKSVVEHLELLRADQPDPVVAEINRLRTHWKLVEPVLENLPLRNELPDTPWEECFSPEPGTQADRQERTLLVQRRVQASAFIPPPGIYLTLLCYSGSQVLCQGGSGALFSELIVSQPTTVELSNFTADSRDFQWVVQLGGANDNWIQETQRWSDTYRNVGRGTFRAKFLHAANRLLHSQPFSTIGFIFDTPVHQPLIRCAHVVTVLRVDQKDRVPVSAGVWRNMTELEQQLYQQTLVANENTRLNFLSTRYEHCKRFVAAAVEARELLDRRLAPGFYLGACVVYAHSGGPMLLVPQGNRMLPPMSLVSETAPTVLQWRWVQSLNERRKRTGSFGLDVPAASTPLQQLTFEQRFARSFDELERAIGISLELLFDREISVLDESQSIRACFAVHLVRPNQVATRPPQDCVALSASVPNAPPGAKVPLVFKHVSVLEDNMLRQYWPKIYPGLSDERTSLFTRAYVTAQPFAIDEVARLQHECAAGFLCDIEKFCLLISWLRPLVTWCLTDGRPLVEEYGGEPNTVALRSIEDAVDVAMSNYSAVQDVNVMTMRSLMFDSITKPHFTWSTLLSQLRERDRVLSAGYGGRLVPAAPQSTVRSLVLRTQDELGPGEEDDDDNPRPPTVYEVPCTLTELIFKDTSAEQAEKYFDLQDIVSDVVERACVSGVDVGHVHEIGRVVSDMISVIEATDDLVSGAALLTLKDQTIDAAWQERQRFQRHWLDVFHTGDTTRRSANGLSLPAPRPEEEEEYNDPLRPALFYDGSPHSITCFADGVRVCLAKSSNTCEQLQQLLRVCNSTVDALELVQSLQDYATCLARRDALVRGTDGVAAGPGDSHSSQLTGSAKHSTGSGVTLVSREFGEYFVPPVDPLRSLVLHNVSGKIRFPTISSGAMEVFAQHARTPDLAIPQSLELLVSNHADMRATEELLDMATQLKAPLLLLRLVTALLGSRRAGTTYFDLKAAFKLRTLFENGFLFEYGIKDWLHLEVLGGQPISAAMDVLWWTRFLKEAAAEVGGASSKLTQREDAYADHEGSWKQVYAETRIRVFLTYGVHALTADEVTLWTESLGRYVEYLTFRETSVTDAEVEVLVSCCPNLKSLDLSFTQVTARAIALLVQQTRCLAECSVAGCNVGPTDLDALRRHCTENRRRTS